MDKEKFQSTHVFHPEKFVTAIIPQRASILQHLLQGRHRCGENILLDRGRGGSLSSGSLETSKHSHMSDTIYTGNKIFNEEHTVLPLNFPKKGAILRVNIQQHCDPTRHLPPQCGRPRSSGSRECLWESIHSLFVEGPGLD